MGIVWGRESAQERREGKQLYGTCSWHKISEWTSVGRMNHDDDRDYGQIT